MNELNDSINNDLDSIDNDYLNLIALMRRENDFLHEQVKESHNHIMGLLEKISQLEEARKQLEPVNGN